MAANGWVSIGDRGDSGQGGEAYAKLTDQGTLAVGGVFRVFGKLEIKIDDVFDVAAGVHLEHLKGAANQDTSGDQGHQGDGNLSGDEDIAEPEAANRRSSRVGLERRGEYGAGAFERGGESEQNAGGKRNGKDVGKDFEVGVHVQNQCAIIGREGFGGHGRQYLHQCPTEQERDAAREQAQQSAFRQQLPDKAQPAGSKGEAHAQFILAGCGTGQLQAGDIGAGDDQHHPDSDHDEQNGVLQSAVQLEREGERGTRPE
jgi:hypothetical protein